MNWTKRVCDYYEISEAVMLGPSKDATVVEARHMLMYLLYVVDGDRSYADVGDLVNRDKSTVHYAVGKVAHALRNNHRETRAAYADLTSPPKSYRWWLGRRLPG
ncbi:MAG TPA: helix-turn-helix domain-containing protein [Thermoleophilia bacterium]|nr:helix-turn-helix domain-containing protein [Thermoleophilia bacterium]